MKEGVSFTFLNTHLTCIFLLPASTKFQRFQDPDSKTQCLFIMGEYDDMKYLVKDGAKKLRDATNLTDEALLSINRQRTSSAASVSYSSPGTPSRKRISPYPTPNCGNFASVRSSSRPRSSNSATHPTPKLKANPRDSRARRPDGGDCGMAVVWAQLDGAADDARVHPVLHIVPLDDQLTPSRALSPAAAGGVWGAGAVEDLVEDAVRVLRRRGRVDVGPEDSNQTVDEAASAVVRDVAAADLLAVSARRDRLAAAVGQLAVVVDVDLLLKGRVDVAWLGFGFGFG